MPTFDTAVRSQALNRPIILYTISTSGAIFRLTTSNVDVVFGGQTFTALTVAHDDQQVSQDPVGDDLIIHLPITHPVVQRFAASGIPDQSVQVTVQELQSTSRTAALSWSGPAQSMSIDGRMASIRVPTSTNDALRIQLPVIGGQKTCNHVLFDQGCAPVPGGTNGGPVSVIFTYTGTITSLSLDGLALTFFAISGVAGAPPDHSLEFGKISTTIAGNNGGKQTRSIVGHIGTFVTISGPPFVATVDQLLAQQYTLEAGCDHTINGSQGCVTKFANRINYGGHPQMNSQQNPWHPGGLGVLQQV